MHNAYDVPNWSKVVYNFPKQQKLETKVCDFQAQRI